MKKIIDARRRVLNRANELLKLRVPNTEKLQGPVVESLLDALLEEVRNEKG